MKPKDKVVEMISAYNDTTMMQDQLISKASECQDLEIQGLVTGSNILILEKKNSLLDPQSLLEKTLRRLRWQPAFWLTSGIPSVSMLNKLLSWQVGRSCTEPSN